MFRFMGSDKFLVRYIYFCIYCFILLVIISNVFGLQGIDLAKENFALYAYTFALLIPSIAFPFVFVIWFIEQLRKPNNKP